MSLNFQSKTSKSALTALICTALLLAGCRLNPPPGQPAAGTAQPTAAGAAGTPAPSATQPEPTVTLTPTSKAAGAFPITIDPAQKFQTIHGWEAVTQSGRADCPGFEQYSSELFDRAVDELGITRVRLELPSGLEARPGQAAGGEREARYRAANDNADPNVIAWDRFDFQRLDPAIQGVVLPLRERLAERGQALWINATFVDFAGNDSRFWKHRDHPEEYAEFVLAFYQYMQETYGFTPDSWEVILEPDTSANWTGEQIGAAILAAGERLEENGFTPRFVAPSVTNAANAVPFLEGMLAAGYIQPWLYEIAYHRYHGGEKETIQDIGKLPEQRGLATAMLEHVGADFHTLYRDLAWASASAWEQYSLAYCNGDSGESYFYIDSTDPQKPLVNLSSRAKMIRQYFHYIRPGDVRVAASAPDETYLPVAFMNGDGQVVTVVIAWRPGKLELRGLPDGGYGVNYSSEANYNVELEPVESENGSLVFQAPEVGVYSVYPIK